MTGTMTSGQINQLWYSTQERLALRVTDPIHWRLRNQTNDGLQVYVLNHVRQPTEEKQLDHITGQVYLQAGEDYR